MRGAHAYTASRVHGTQGQGVAYHFQALMDDGARLVRLRVPCRTPPIHRVQPGAGLDGGQSQPPECWVGLKTGEVDMGVLPPEEAAAVRDDPRLPLVPASTGITAWLEFPGQWEPASPWHDRRVRLAANLAIDKHALSDVVGLGLDRPTGSIIPRALEFALPLEPFPYDPAQAKRLLAETGYPQGFDAGDLTPFPPILRVAEAVGGYLGAVGIRLSMAVVAGGLALSGRVSAVLAQGLRRTPGQILAPFYPVAKPPHQGADLTAMPGKAGRAAGQVTYVVWSNAAPLVLHPRLRTRSDRDARGDMEENWGAEREPTA